MIPIKTSSEIKIMEDGGKITAAALDKAISMVDIGKSASEIDDEINKFIVGKGAVPSFINVEGFGYATCINVNSGVVHGVPGDYRFKKGDVVSVDLGVYYKGFHTDAASSVEVASGVNKKFLSVGEKTLNKAASKCYVGNTIGDVSNAIQVEIEENGYSVSRDLVGHGIGKELHEDPHVPGYGKRGKGEKIKEGMVFAIEVIYQKGSPEIVVLDDDWTIETADGSLAGLFEHTVAVFGTGPVVLTAR